MGKTWVFACSIGFELLVCFKPLTHSLLKRVSTSKAVKRCIWWSSGANFLSGLITTNLLIFNKNEEPWFYVANTNIHSCNMLSRFTESTLCQHLTTQMVARAHNKGSALLKEMIRIDSTFFFQRPHYLVMRWISFLVLFVISFLDGECMSWK